MSRLALGVVAALPAEGRCLAGRRLTPGESLRLPGNTRLHLCGVGPLRARLAAEALLRAGASALVSWGTAGGLGHGATTGSLVLPETVVAPDQAVYASNRAWRERLIIRVGGRLDVRTEALVSSARALTRRGEKAALRRRTGAIAVDMESAAVAAAAQRAGVPFLAVRAVTDPVEAPLPPIALAAVDTAGRLRPVRLAAALAERPRDGLALWRLARQFRAARRTLCSVARLAGCDLLWGEGSSPRPTGSCGQPITSRESPITDY